MRRLLLVLLVLVAALNASGCGMQPGSEAPTMAPADIAKLLTAPEVEKIYGKPVTQAPKDVNNAGDLNFRSPGERNTLMLKLHIQETYAFKISKEDAKLKCFLSAQDGMGDDAFWCGVDVPNALFVRKGNRVFQLVTTGGSSKSPPPMVNQSQMVELAKVVLSRL